ncbi:MULTISPECIES: hypothetical protein [unclassified Saccharopolyspora]|uniref:pPIWI_RE_Z domain-containing protein n=1 Tax=unclassified Saccharopolyspora TaxID=2646250 RepID=UPI001CD3A9D6|nr:MULTISPECIES: hypothetical protein [unclassified Saccharopolyspora]MCA1186189.1 hypothetical protein [Saccharopolyspora sp. 6T]MCA1278392.1 hypothetical protein [Saccharopolyspora sp. 7B]
MRSSAPLFAEIVQIIKAASDLKSQQIHDMLATELGLLVAEQIMPENPVRGAWTLFSGYPFATHRGLVTTEQQRRTLSIARFELWTRRRRSAWLDALDRYSEFDEGLRAYCKIDLDSPAERRTLSVAPDRFDVYESLIAGPAPFEGGPIETAEAGPHSFRRGQELVTVHLPDVDLPEPEGHDLGEPARNGGAPHRITKSALVETAKEMDQRKNARWEQRLGTSRLFTKLDDEFVITDDPSLDLDGFLHLQGIVGAGKSTLRDVLTVHCVRKLGMRVTIVLGDVAECLRLTDLLQLHGCKAAPIIGQSNREQHAQRLHRRQSSRGAVNLLAHDDPGFEYLSTTCLLNTFLDDEPLTANEVPCTTLRSNVRDRTRRSPVWTLDGVEPRLGRKRLACPYWTGCPRHHGARELVDADVWISTPASLIDARVPWPQNGERIRYFELACRRSDLIIVDEADKVQIQFDAMFAPAVPLVGRLSSSWLDRLSTHKIEELAISGRVQLSDSDVQNWSAALNTATLATDRLYGLLVREHDIRRWLRSGHFSSWSLQQDLVLDRYEISEEAGPAAQALIEGQRRELEEILDRFRDDPFGDRSDAERRPDPELVRLTSELLHTTRLPRTRAQLRRKLHRLLRLDEHDDPDGFLEKWGQRFEFTLLLAALEPKLALMTAMWPRVQAALNLEFNQLYRKPIDYGPVVPESPMGNVLGFQFHAESADAGGVHSGELRFFQCAGVGRKMFDAMRSLPAADGRSSPHVLLMSGSSWAGSSTRYHVDFPVDALIAPQQEDIDKVARSDFRFRPVNPGPHALRVSGCTDPDKRIKVLEQLAVELGGSNGPDLSPLEAELREIGDDDRWRILLLVGSYDEAERVADKLHGLRRWKGRVRRLARDDDEIGPDSADRSPVLRRGDVETLAQTNTELLVAPLLAIERGHNILNELGKAAIGSVYFLVRPNPRPDDLVLAVHAVNDWSVRIQRDGRFAMWVSGADTLDAAGYAFRAEARREWRRVLRRSTAWSRLGDDRESFTWDMLVVIWQVIGRLVRGGVSARVTFVDEAFAPESAAGRGMDTADTSLLVSMYAVLQKYRSPGPASPGAPPRHEQQLVEGLYAPLHEALERCLEDMRAGGPTR